MLSISKWMKVLNYLYINKDSYSYVTEISIKTEISLAYTFRVINFLIKKKLIVNIDDNKRDIRNRYVSLTTKGEIVAKDCYNLIIKRNELMK